MIYLDQAATSFLKPPQVKQAVLRSFDEIGNGGRGAHAPTLAASRLIYDTREKLAELFGVPDAGRIALLSNATEALNTAILGLFAPGDHVITTACEHNSVLRPLYCVEQQGVEVTHIPADGQGTIDYAKMEQSCKKNTKAVVITHASNVTGMITDLQRVSEFAEKNGLLLVVDASQTAGALPIDVKNPKIDILCFTGHKGLLGPQGTGGIYVRPGMELLPLKSGGSGSRSYEKSQPAGMPGVLEAGTQNGHGIAGLRESVSFLLHTGVQEIHRRELKLADQFLAGVRQVDGVRLYGDCCASERMPIVSLNIGDENSAAVSDWLWEDYGICVRGGAHCAPLMHQALGTKKQGTVRFSFSYFNTEEEVEQAVRAVRELAE